MSAPWTRRRFLRAAALGAFGASAWSGSLCGIGLSAARAASGGYRALVGIDLDGGNDGFNLLIPTDDERYGDYAAARSALAVARERLVRIEPVNEGPFGVHPSARPLARLFGQRRLAFVSNVGVLEAPTSRADVAAHRHLPPALFSHADQRTRWMSAQAETRGTRTGWAGRLADLLQADLPAGGVAMNLSVAGGNLLQTGAATAPYVLAPDGAIAFNGAPPGSMRADTLARLRSDVHAGDQLLEAYLARVTETSIDLAGRIRTALDVTPPLATRFPDTGLGAQLRMVARLVAARDRIGSPSRQVFFVRQTGFDLHDRQAGEHPALLRTVAEALEAFDEAMIELGTSENVTAFTMSEFGRTLTGNGDGTDHGWGSHHLVAGGAVRGRRIAGRVPDLAPGGADDIGRGCILPGISVDQYMATLARWLGATDDDLRAIFPNLVRFDRPDLGLMS